ncbi:jg7473, partial [Pararge aegeria aegeria]
HAGEYWCLERLVDQPAPHEDDQPPFGSGVRVVVVQPVAMVARETWVHPGGEVRLAEHGHVYVLFCEEMPCEDGLL